MTGRPSSMLLTLLLAALVAGACGSLSPDSLAFAEAEERPGRTVLRVATYRSDGLIDAVEQWEREHPTAEVLIERRAIDDHHAQILEPSAAVPTPDIIVYDSDYAGQFRNQTDLFADLATLGGKEFEDTSLAWRWQQGVADDDTLVGVPIDVGGMALAFRTDLVWPTTATALEEVDSWCDLIAIGDRYADRSGNAFLPNAPDLFDAILNQAPLRFHNNDGRLIHSTNPAVRSAWDHTMRAVGERPLFDDPCPDHVDILRISANLESGSDDWIEALQSGDFAALLAPASTLDVIRANVPSTSGEWRLVPVPGSGAGSSGGAQLAIHQASENKDLAYNLIAHLADSSTQLRTFNEVGNLPVAEPLYESNQLSGYELEFFGDSEIGSIYIDSVTSFFAAPDGPEHRLILDEYRSAVSRVESGNQTPEEAWNEALWRIELLLE